MKLDVNSQLRSTATMKNPSALLFILLLFGTSHSLAQSVVNGSIDGTPTGNSQFGNVPGWLECTDNVGGSNSCDVCDPGYPSYNGNSTVTPIDSPDGGNWIGLAMDENGLGDIQEDECVIGEMIDLVVGDSYTLVFYGANFGAGAGSFSDGPNGLVDITIAGQTTTVEIPQVASTWNTYCVSFTADAETMNFRVHNAAGSSYVVLDGFSLGNTPWDAPLSDADLCPGDDILLDASSGAGAVYEWQDLSTSATFLVTEPGTYSVEVEIDGCTYFDEAEITGIICEPTVVLEDITICEGNCAILSAEISGFSTITSITWNQGLTDMDAEVMVCPDITTSYSITVTDDMGESVVAQATVTVADAVSCGPDLNIPDTQVCLGDCVTITATHSLPSAFDQLSSDDDLSFVGADITACPESTSSYTVTAIDVDGNSVTTQFEVVVNSLPSVDLGPDVFLCPDQADLVLDAGPGAATYLWQDFSIDQTLVTGTPGEYIVIYTDANDCVASDTMLVNGPQPLSVDLGADQVFCEFQPYELNASNPLYVTEWQDGSLENNYMVSSTGTYYVTVYNEACPNVFVSDTVIVEYPIVEASFSYLPKPPGKLEPIQFTSEATGATSWAWDFGDGNTSDEEHPMHSYDTQCFSVVTLIASNEQCAETAIGELAVKEEITVFTPTAFTPNADQVNEFYRPVINSCNPLEEYQFTIVDRWGTVVFDSEDREQGWDGSNQGGSYFVTDGYYHWVLRFRPANTSIVTRKTGDVLIIR